MAKRTIALIGIAAISLTGFKYGPTVMRQLREEAEVQSGADEAAKADEKAKAEAAAAERLEDERVEAEAREREAKYHDEYAAMRFFRRAVIIMETAPSYSVPEFEDSVRTEEAACAKLSEQPFAANALAQELSTQFTASLDLRRQATAKANEAERFLDRTFAVRNDETLGPARMQSYNGLHAAASELMLQAESASSKFAETYNQAEEKYGTPRIDPREHVDDLRTEMLKQFGSRSGHKLQDLKWIGEEKEVRIIILVDSWGWIAGAVAKSTSIEAIRAVEKADLKWQKLYVEIDNTTRAKDVYGNVTEGQEPLSKATWGRDKIKKINWPEFESDRIWELADKVEQKP